MRVSGSGKETFLYINGLRTERPVKLSRNVELLPAQTEVSAELFLSLGNSDIDISVISLFLPLVESQLRVRGRGGKDVSLRAWNATWDLLLLGALHDCEAICNLQANISAEQLNLKSHLEVTNYHLRGLSPQPLRCLTESEAQWIEQNFDAAQRLLEDDRFQSAVHCLATYRWHTMPRARLAILWSGIEGLFGVDGEVVFRVSLYIARFLAPDDRTRQQDIFGTVKRLYKLRSQAVHGTRIKGDAKSGVSESAELLRSLVAQCVNLQALPETAKLIP